MALKLLLDMTSRCVLLRLLESYVVLRVIVEQVCSSTSQKDSNILVVLP